MVKLATSWLTTCSGCHISILDLKETIVDLLTTKLELVYCPIADFKKIPENIDVAIIDGGISNSENEAIAKELREKAKIVIALGSCACFGGIPSLRNIHKFKNVQERGYITTESTVSGKIPKSDELPTLYEKIKPLKDFIKVDVSLPGCPPPSKLIGEAVISLLENKPFSLPEYNLCKECTRTIKYSHNRKFDIQQFKEISEGIPDNEQCLLEQGFLCMGPVTNAGCEALCINANVPCRGCFGPSKNVTDMGISLINALGTIENIGDLYNIDMVSELYRYIMGDSTISKLKSKEE